MRWEVCELQLTAPLEVSLTAPDELLEADVVAQVDLPEASDWATELLVATLLAEQLPEEKL